MPEEEKKASKGKSKWLRRTLIALGIVLVLWVGSYAFMRSVKIFEPVVMVAAGYLGDESLLDENLVVPKGPDRSRRPLNKLVFDDDWSELK